MGPVLAATYSSVINEEVLMAVIIDYTVPNEIVFETGRFRVHHRTWVAWDGTETRLSPTESELMVYMARRPGVNLSRELLLQEVWDYAPGVRSRAVDNTMARLRKKIEADPANPSILVSAWGQGYRLEGLRLPGRSRPRPASTRRRWQARVGEDRVARWPAPPRLRASCAGQGRRPALRAR